MNFKRAFLVLAAALLLPGLAMAGTTALATFFTDFYFDDNNDWDSGEVHIACTGGLPLNSSQILMDGDDVTFVLEFPEEGELGQTDCHIFVDDLTTDDYTAEYFCEGETSCEYDSDGCWFFDVIDGDTNLCNITMDPNDAFLRVWKEWDIIGNSAQNNIGVINLDARITVCTDNEDVIQNDNYSPRTGLYCVTGTVYGPSDDYLDVVFDNTQHDGDRVYIFERTFDSAVETENNCSSYTVTPGDSRSCTIINTVFYEGIPTLNQYGLAIMALLMLGIGFVGFRRFV